jgi:hypothetical protein
LLAHTFWCFVSAANYRAGSQHRLDGAMRTEFAKTLFLIWNALGLMDIIFVVFSALRFGLNDWQSMHALRVLPLSLLPTFLVPLVIASHVVIFVRLTRAGTGLQ